MKYAFISVLFISLLAFAIVDTINPVPTTLEDFVLPGSQPGESGNLENPNKCDNCHGGYNSAVEPAHNWRGSMMSQAMRDPLFLASMTIANQDAPESGDLCIRCHSPKGWLEGRSTPTDGSALTTADREGVQCDFCHKLVKPTIPGINPYPGDPDYLAGTYEADSTYLSEIAAIPEVEANGMYIADDANVKRGPYTDPNANHQFYYSPFHKESAICGTCHDVSNPVYDAVRDASDHIIGYTPNTFNAAPSSSNPYDLFPVERTYSEWLMSDYNSPTGVYSPIFGGNLDFVASCQDCHMRDVTGPGCNKNGAPIRDDLPLHDMTGGNTFIPSLIEEVFPGETDPDAIQDGITRAMYMLTNAATVTLTVDEANQTANVHVVNETGHKLPSGYPEGRRIWINLKAWSATNMYYESGAYNFNTGVLTQDSAIKIYQIKPGISPDIAAVTNLSSGPSFHFVLNDTIFFDNRIPPRGFSNANFEAIQSPPVGYSYADGQYWDDTEYTLPFVPVGIEVTLYYQTVSKEYVEFLKNENTTDDWGQIMYDLWNDNGKSTPVAMNTVVWGTPGGLPIELVEFQANINDKGTVELLWETHSEVNSSHFVVQRSLNSSSWDNLATIKASGMSVRKKVYQYTDLSPDQGYNYYRIKLVDNDGIYRYTQVRSVQINASGITISPNPFSEQITLTGSGHNKNIKMFIFDTNNKLQGIVDLPKFSGVEQISLSSLTAGIYVIYIEENGQFIYSQKLIKTN